MSLQRRSRPPPLLIPDSSPSAHMMGSPSPGAAGPGMGSAPQSPALSPRIRTRRPSQMSSRSQAPIMQDANMFSCPHGGRNMHMIINLTLLVSSLFLMGVGSGLMGFYRIHLLEVISVDFLLVPLFLILGGMFTLFTALFGFYAGSREDSCLMITYSVLMSLQFLMLLGGIVSSVKLIVDIKMGLLNANVVPELARYETDAWVSYKWDTMQREFTCCGGYGYNQGYIAWKHTLMGGKAMSVPDSCCHTESPGCGRNLFQTTDLKNIVERIHAHGCLTIMQVRLKTHVSVILIVFAVFGSLLSMLELLSIVLACCMASHIAHSEDMDDWDYDGGPYLAGGGIGYDDADYSGGGVGRFGDAGAGSGGGLNRPLRTPRPVTPQTLMSNDLSSHHETAF